MIQKSEPCPLCGKEEGSGESQRKEKEQALKHLKAFLCGRESILKLSKRENQVIDCFYKNDINDFKIIAKILRISSSTVETYYDRAMDKIINLDFEL